MVKLLFSRTSPPTSQTSYPFSSSRGGGAWNLGDQIGSIVKMEGSYDAINTSGSIVAATSPMTSPMMVSATPQHQQHQQQAKKSDPSTCMFWCAVALGGLTQGQPVVNVSGNRQALRRIAPSKIRVCAGVL